jgi:hypothetical protein
MTPPTPAWYWKGCCPGSLVDLIVRRTCRILARQVPVRMSALWSAQSHLAEGKSRVTAQRTACSIDFKLAKNWNAPELFAGLLHDSCRMHCDRVALGHRRTGAGLHDLIRRRVSWECRHLLQSACSTKMGEKEKRAWRRGGASWTVACPVQWRRRRHPRCVCTDLVHDHRPSFACVLVCCRRGTRPSIHGGCSLMVK